MLKQAKKTAEALIVGERNGWYFDFIVLIFFLVCWNVEDGVCLVIAGGLAAAA
jgi:hypothetical protein